MHHIACDCTHYYAGRCHYPEVETVLVDSERVCCEQELVPRALREVEAVAAAAWAAREPGRVVVVEEQRSGAVIWALVGIAVAVVVVVYAVLERLGT